MLSFIDANDDNCNTQPQHSTPIKRQQAYMWKAQPGSDCGGLENNIVKMPIEGENHRHQLSHSSTSSSQDMMLTDQRGPNMSHFMGGDVTTCNHMHKGNNMSFSQDVPASFGMPESRKMAAHIEQDVINKQRAEIHLLMEELSTRDSELNDLVRSHQSQVKAWDKDRERLADLQSRLHQYEEELEKNDHQLKQTVSEMSRVNEQKENEANELKKTKEEIQRLDEKIKENFKYIKDIEKENKNLSKSVRELVGIRHAMEAREKETDLLIKEKDKDISDNLAEIASLNEQLRSLKTTSEQVKEKLCNANTESASWKKKYCQARDEADQLQRECTTKDEAISKMTQQLHESLQQAIALQKALFTSCEREKCKEGVISSLKKQQKRTMQELSSLRILYDRQNTDLTYCRLSVKDTESRRESKRCKERGKSLEKCFSKQSQSESKFKSNRHRSQSENPELKYTNEESKKHTDEIACNHKYGEKDKTASSAGSTERDVSTFQSDRSRGRHRIREQRTKYGTSCLELGNTSMETEGYMIKHTSSGDKRSPKDINSCQVEEMSPHGSSTKSPQSSKKQLTSPLAASAVNISSKYDCHNQWRLRDNAADKEKCSYESSDVSPFSSPERPCDDDIASADSEGLCSELKRDIGPVRKENNLSDKDPHSAGKCFPGNSIFRGMPSSLEPNIERESFLKKDIVINLASSKGDDEDTSTSQIFSSSRNNYNHSKYDQTDSGIDTLSKRKTDFRSHRDGDVKNTSKDFNNEGHQYKVDNIKNKKQTVVQLPRPKDDILNRNCNIETQKLHEMKTTPLNQGINYTPQNEDNNGAQSPCSTKLKVKFKDDFSYEKLTPKEFSNCPSNSQVKSSLADLRHHHFSTIDNSILFQDEDESTQRSDYLAQKKSPVTTGIALVRSDSFQKDDDSSQMKDDPNKSSSNNKMNKFNCMGRKYTQSTSSDLTCDSLSSQSNQNMPDDSLSAFKQETCLKNRENVWKTGIHVKSSQHSNCNSPIPRVEYSEDSSKMDLSRKSTDNSSNQSARLRPYFYEECSDQNQKNGQSDYSLNKTVTEDISSSSSFTTRNRTSANCSSSTAQAKPFHASNKSVQPENGNNNNCSNDSDSGKYSLNLDVELLGASKTIDSGIEKQCTDTSADISAQKEIQTDISFKPFNPRAPSLFKQLSKIHFCEKTKRYEWTAEDRFDQHSKVNDHLDNDSNLCSGDCSYSSQTNSENFKQPNEPNSIKSYSGKDLDSHCVNLRSSPSCSKTNGILPIQYVTECTHSLENSLCEENVAVTDQDNDLENYTTDRQLDSCSSDFLEKPSFLSPEKPDVPLKHLDPKTPEGVKQIQTLQPVVKKLNFSMTFDEEDTANADNTYQTATNYCENVNDCYTELPIQHSHSHTDSLTPPSQPKSIPSLVSVGRNNGIESSHQLSKKISNQSEAEEYSNCSIDYVPTRDTIPRDVIMMPNIPLDQDLNVNDNLTDYFNDISGITDELVDNDKYPQKVDGVSDKEKSLNILERSETVHAQTLKLLQFSSTSYRSLDIPDHDQYMSYKDVMYNDTESSGHKHLSTKNDLSKRLAKKQIAVNKSVDNQLEEKEPYFLERTKDADAEKIHDKKTSFVPMSPATRLHQLLMDSQEMVSRLEKTSAIPRAVRNKNPVSDQI